MENKWKKYKDRFAGRPGRKTDPVIEARKARSVLISWETLDNEEAMDKMLKGYEIKGVHEFIRDRDFLMEFEEIADLKSDNQSIWCLFTEEGYSCDDRLVHYFSSKPTIKNLQKLLYNEFDKGGIEEEDIMDLLNGRCPEIYGEKYYFIEVEKKSFPEELNSFLTYIK
jgi:hypothetical protein